jgi:hypothetical protein
MLPLRFLLLDLSLLDEGLRRDGHCPLRKMLMISKRVNWSMYQKNRG